MLRAGLLLVIVACGGGKTDIDVVLTEGEAIADRLCACKDLACATKEAEALDAHFDKHAGKDSDLTEPQRQRSLAIAKKVTKCSAALASPSP